MNFSSFMSRLRGIFHSVRTRSSRIWTSYRQMPLWQQIGIALVILAVLYGISTLLRGGAAASDTNTTAPAVTLATVASLSGTSGSVNVLGTVRSISEADILAQSGGSVTALHAGLGAYVPTGYVIAELENASQRASVLQAEGSYDAALALQAGASPTDIAATARNTYTTAYSTLDTLLKSDIDLFFGDTGGQGPQLLISNTPYDYAYFPMKRQALTNAMTTWQQHLATAASSDPQTLLNEADMIVRLATALGNDLSRAATQPNSNANSAQLAALATARAGFASLQASITAAKTSYQGQNTSATAGTAASIKIALGSLRAAQAQLEKTLIRAPISGTVNFLTLHVGDYVTPLTHVATVAQNGALEITASVSEDTSSHLSVATKVLVEDIYPAVITSIAPALDPVTKQIEMHVTLTGKSPLVNGQSVRISLPTDTTNAKPATVATSTAQALLLPLTALKLTPAARVVFSVGTDDRLVAHPVTIGEVHGDRIEVTTALPEDLRIVTDARGLSEGQKVMISTTP